MIDMRYKPYFLPQVNAPYEDVLQKLDEEGISYELVEITPDDLNASQGLTFSDEVANVTLDDTNPIWLADENKILDGHHRWVKAMMENKPIKAVHIKLNEKDAARALNKIQDIYEYEQSQGLEEVEMQGAINYYGDDENQFLTSLEEDNMALQAEKPEKNDKILIGFRKEPINERSVVGNFFTLEPINGFDKYEIAFDNLLDTNELGIAYKDGQEPVDILAKIWFPNVNFEKISENYNMPSVNLKTKAIAEKAMKLGYDGIKFGDKLIQGLK
jgi:hypothetical protein